MTDQTPQISVIVPVYNGREAIVPCLAAVRAQEGITRGEIELIVVDDGSSDNSAEAAAPLCDRVVRMERNRGAAAARNRGAREARAELLVFVDADVRLMPRALARLLALFQGRTGLSAAVGRYTERPAAPGIINQYHNSFTRFHHDLSEKQIDWFWGALGAVRRRAFWAAGGFNELYRGASAEDMEFGRTLAGLGHLIVYCPEAEGAHAHRFSFWKMMVNDYKKAVLGTKLRLLDRLPRRAPGFANVPAMLSAVLAPCLFLALALSINEPDQRANAFCIMLFLLLLNSRFYRYLARYLKGPYLVPGVLLHWVQLTAMAAGAGAGALGHLLGRPPYGRPGWI